MVKKVKTKELVPTNEIRDIALKAEELIDKSNVFMQITTRGADPNSKSLVDFKVFDDAKLAKLAENMPEINRATQVFGRQNSQATGKLMSLNMISQGPYRRLKQCLAKIERKRGALKENIFKLRKEKLEIDKLLYSKRIFESQLSTSVDPQEIEFEIQAIEIELQEKATNISDTNLYMEGALKEIGMYQEAYSEIKEAHNIPDKWDESDFEKSEVENHLKEAFCHLIRDIEMTGRINCGTSEYLFQYGVNPTTAVKLVHMYLANIDKLSSEGKFPNVTVLYDFLDEMAKTFKEEYKHAMRRIGLKTLVSEDYLYIEEKTAEDSI